jgi:hypothetical protein
MLLIADSRRKLATSEKKMLNVDNATSLMSDFQFCFQRLCDWGLRSI